MSVDGPLWPAATVSGGAGVMADGWCGRPAERLTGSRGQAPRDPLARCVGRGEPTRAGCRRGHDHHAGHDHPAQATDLFVLQRHGPAQYVHSVLWTASGHTRFRRVPPARHVVHPTHPHHGVRVERLVLETRALWVVHWSQVPPSVPGLRLRPEPERPACCPGVRGGPARNRLMRSGSWRFCRAGTLITANRTYTAIQKTTIPNANNCCFISRHRRSQPASLGRTWSLRPGSPCARKGPHAAGTTPLAALCRQRLLRTPDTSCTRPRRPARFQKRRDAAPSPRNAAPSLPPSRSPSSWFDSLSPATAIHRQRMPHSPAVRDPP